MIFTSFNLKLRKLSRSSDGATGVEYGMLAGLVGVAITGAIVSMSDTSTASYFNLAKAMAHGGVGDFLGEDGKFDYGDVDIEDIVRETIGWAHVSGIDGWEFIGVGGVGELVKGGYIGGGKFADGADGTWDHEGTFLHMSANQGLTMKKELDLVQGGEYDFTLDAKKHGDGQLEVWFGGNLINTFEGGQGEWTTTTMKLKAGDGDGLDELIVKEVGSYDSSRPYLGTGVKNLTIE